MIPRLDLLTLDESYAHIPISWGSERVYTITLEGGGPVCLIETDENLVEICQIMSAMTDTFLCLFKTTHAFTKPELCFTPDGKFSVKIGMMSLEEFMERNI